LSRSIAHIDSVFMPFDFAKVKICWAGSG